MVDNGNSVFTKISPPDTGKTFQRRRLFQLLNQYSEKPAVWISGPAGSGKTTLAVSYLKARNYSSIWYHMNDDDLDPANLFYYLGTAAGDHSVPDQDQLPLLTAESLGGMSVFVRNYFETFFQRFEPPFVLVLDNCQEIGDGACFHKIVRDMISVVPFGFQVYMISRSRPPKELSRLLVHQEMPVIKWRDLQLTVDEIQGFAGLNSNTPLDNAGARSVHALTLGWAAGVILLLSQPENHRKPSKHPILFNTRAVFDYFSRHVLAELDHRVKLILLKCSILPQIHPGMAAKLTNNPNAEQILAELAANNHFTIRRNGKGSVFYEFHPLFKEYLKDQAQSALTLDELQNMENQALGILLDQHQYEHAEELLEKTKNWTGLSDLILRRAKSMVMHGRSATLLKWIERIPESELSQVPGLLYWRGTCTMNFDLLSSRSYFERAFTCFKRLNDATGCYTAWAGVVDTHVFEWGNMKPLDRWIHEIGVLLKSHPGFASQEVEAQVTSAVFFALMYRCPDHPDMHQWEKRVKSIFLKTHDMNLKFGLGSHLVLYYTWWIGGQAEAAFISDTLKHALSGADVAPVYRIIWHTLKGINLWMTNHYRESRHESKAGLSIAKKNGIHFWDFMLLSNLTHCSLCQGYIQSARKYLKKMAFVQNTNRTLDITQFYYLKAYAELNSGNLDHALDQINEAVEHGKNSGSPFAYHWSATGKADILIERGEYDQAREIIDQVYLFGQKMNSRNIEYQCEWLWARIQFKQNNEKAGFAHLRQYLSISKKHDTVNHSGWRSSVMAPLLQKALEASMDIDHVQRIIKEHDILPPDSGGYVDHWPYPLRIRTLGSFSILIDDKPLSHKDRGQAKPLMLLKALIALGGEDVSEHRLSRMLWPDADIETARAAFNTTLHRLRKLIGQEQVIILKDHRISLDSQRCWIDVWCLKYHLGQSNAMDHAQTANLPNRSQILDEIIQLYRGPFLEGEHDHWVIGPREHQKNQVIRQVKQIAVLNEKRKQWQKAKAIYEQGLKIDNLVEEFYQGTMRCCLAMDQHAEGLKAYHRLYKLFFNILGVEPSPETQYLKRRLQGKDPDR